MFVKFRPIINQILDVSEVNQKIDIKLWFLHEWIDERLVWDPNEFGGIKELNKKRLQMFQILLMLRIILIRKYLS